MARRDKKRKHRPKSGQSTRNGAGAKRASASPASFALKKAADARRNVAPALATSVPVWDLAVRLFHWSLVIGVCLAWATGGSGGGVHEIAGYTVAGLVAFRLVWGFVGTRHARFSDFVKSPFVIVAYLRQMIGGHPPRSLGHNPAGGVMIVALLALLVVLSVTGWLMLTPQFFGVPWVEDLHALAANGLLIAVPLHLAGVIASSLMHRENLVAAMLTGRKTVKGREGRLIARQGRLPTSRLVQQGVGVLLALALVGAGYGWIMTSRHVSTPVVETGQPAPVAR